MINKTELETHCKSGRTQREIADHYGVSQSTIKHWLSKYELSTENGKMPRSKSFLCRCGESNPDKFYGNKRSVCGACHNKDVTKRGTENKKFAIALLGSKCSNCGYDRSTWALQFHHLSDKDPNFGSMRGWSRSRIEKELKNCVLLCANCHFEEHERLHKMACNTKVVCSTVNRD